MNSIVIAYGTWSSEKIAALYAALLRLGRMERFRVHTINALSMVDAQPIGWKKGELGAENRALGALGACADADYGLGVESYFERRRSRWLDFAAVAVIARATGEVVAQSTSVGVAMPDEFVIEAICRGTEQWTAGEVYAEKHGHVKAAAWHRNVTNGRLERVDLMADAVYAALVQVPEL